VPDLHGVAVIFELVVTEGEMVLIRRATPAEMEDLAAFTVDDPVGSADTDRFREESAPAGCVRNGHGSPPMSPGSSRVPCGGGARTASTQSPSTACTCCPRLPDRAALAAGLLSRGHAEVGAAPDFNLVLRTGWREEPAIRPQRGAPMRPGRPG